METDYQKIKFTILDTFFYEEETIFHVDNYLRYKNIHCTRNEIKHYITDLIKDDFLKLIDDPSNGEIEFQNSNEEFEEDYWFELTKKGFKELNNYRKHKISP